MERVKSFKNVKKENSQYPSENLSFINTSSYKNGSNSLSHLLEFHRVCQKRKMILFLYTIRKSF